MYDKTYMKQYMKIYRIKNREKRKRYNKQYRQINSNREKEYHRNYYIKNRDGILERTSKYKKNNPKKIKEKNRTYYENNYKKINARSKKYRESNIEKERKRRIRYCKNNPEKLKNYHKEYNRDKYKTDVRYNLNRKMSTAIGMSLKGNKKGKHWEDLVGYTLSDLIKNLKKTIPKGYIWQDYISGMLELDHIIPISVFNFTKFEHTDFKRCWALSNLRLLHRKENRIKHNKIKRPFQPALAI